MIENHKALKITRVILLIISWLSVFAALYYIQATRVYSYLVPIIFLFNYHRSYRHRVYGFVRLILIAFVWVLLMIGFNGPDQVKSHFENTLKYITHYYHQITNDQKGDGKNVEK